MPLATAGPKERAGFIEPPVSGPMARMSAAIVNPIASPPMRGAFGSTAVPKITNARKNVAMASSPIACPKEISGATDCPPRRMDVATCAGNSPLSAYAAAMAPRICPAMYTPAIIGSMRRAAKNPIVMEGFRWPEMRIVALTITARMIPCASATPTNPPPAAIEAPPTNTNANVPTNSATK